MELHHQYRYLQQLLASAFLMRHGPGKVKEEFDGRVVLTWLEPLEGEEAKEWQKKIDAACPEKVQKIEHYAREFESLAPGMEPIETAVRMTIASSEFIPAPIAA